VVKVSAIPTAEDGTTEIVQVEGVLPTVTGLVHETVVVVAVGTAKAGFKLAAHDSARNNDTKVSRESKLLMLTNELFSALT
jgi:hypothetical protein